MNRSFHRITVMLLIALSSQLSWASSVEQLFKLSLEELLALEVDTASVSKLQLRKQPATITVLQSSDIQALAARNLMEILERLPGFSYGVDVYGVTGVVFRGMWAHEGKILLLIDDMPVNDLLYANLSLAFRYPANQIDRVEVLRGAGSTKYGGNAQLAVVKVFTKKYQGKANFQLSTHAMTQGSTGYQMDFLTGTGGEDYNWSLSASLGDYDWGNQNWIDSQGTHWSLSKLAQVTTANIISKLNYRDLSVRLLYDRQINATPHRFGQGYLGEEVEFSSLNTLITYNATINQQWSVQPSLNYRVQNDWFIRRAQEASAAPNFEIEASRLNGNIDVIYRGDDFDLQSGVQLWSESATSLSAGYAAPVPDEFFDGKGDVAYHGQSVYLSTDWHFDKLNASFGIRYSNHNLAGASVVPRVALNYVEQNWHIKGYVGEAYREPGILIIRNAEDKQAIAPEQTRQSEIEFGYKLNADWFATFALYKMRVSDPIYYLSSEINSVLSDVYINKDKLETIGLESELKGVIDDVFVVFNHSYYKVPNTPDTVYQVDGKNDLHRGAPQHKLSLSVEQLITPNLSLKPSVTSYINNYANRYTADTEQLVTAKLKNITLANVVIEYQHQHQKLSLGVYDIFNHGRTLPQPYAGESPEFSMGGRELWLSISIDF